MKLWGVPVAVWVIVVLGVLLWLGALVVGIWLSPPTNRTWLDDAAGIGDACAPLGAIATIAALVYAFHESRASSERAHHDRLAEAYQAWLPEARRLLAELLDVAADGEKYIELWRNEMMAGFPDSKVRACGDDIRGHLRGSLRESATGVLLFETDRERRKQIATVVRRFQVPDLTTADTAFPDSLPAAWNGLMEDVRKRREALVQLQKDVTTRVSARASVPEVAIDD